MRDRGFSFGRFFVSMTSEWGRDVLTLFGIGYVVSECADHITRGVSFGIAGIVFWFGWWKDTDKPKAEFEKQFEWRSIFRGAEGGKVS